MKLTIALATRGRPELLVETIRRTLENIRHPETKLVVSADADDQSTIDALVLDGQSIFGDSVDVLLGSRPDSLGEKYNRCCLAYPADVYLAMVDYAPHVTPGFDEIILDAAQTYPDGICLVLNDLANLSFSGINAITHTMSTLVGGFYTQEYPFWYLDHDLEDIGKMCGRIAYCDVQIDTSARPGTQSRRDVRFWCEYFIRSTPLRERTASRIIRRMDAPKWQKGALIRNFPLVRQRSEILNRIAIQETAGLPEVPDDERHQRLRAKANQVLIAIGAEPIPEPESENTTPQRHPMSVVLALPNYSWLVAQEFARSLGMTIFALTVNGIPFRLIDDGGNGFVDFSRNKLGTAFGEEPQLSQFENVLYLDDDIGWQPDAVLRSLARPEPIVIGCYPVKQDPHLPPKFPVDFEKDEDGKVVTSADGRLIKVRRVMPAGFLRIKRWVIERFRAEYGTFIDGHPQADGTFKAYIEMFRAGVLPIPEHMKAQYGQHNGQQCGEDKVFADRCQELGIDIWCDPDIEFVHRGSHLWRGRLADIFDRQEKEDGEV